MRVARLLGLVLAGVSALLIALLVVAAVALNFIDFNRYKPLIADEVRKATGRDFTISGNLHVDVSLIPAIVVDDVRLSNAAWGSRPEMVSARRLKVQIVLLSLVFGDLEIRRVELAGADILLEIDPQGRANFEFEPPGAKAAEPKQPAKGIAATDILPLAPEAEVRDSRLTYVNAVTGTTYSTDVDSLILRGGGPAEPLSLVYEGSFNASPFRASARLGGPAGPPERGKPWPVHLSIEAGGAEVTVEGSVAEPFAGKGLDLAISVDGNQTDSLSNLVGVEVPALGPYSISARATGNAASVVNLAGLKAKVGASDLAGDATVTLAGERPFIAADVSSQTVDLAILGGVGGDRDYVGEDGAAKKPDRLFPDDSLSMAGLNAVDVELRLSAATLTGRRVPLRNAVVRLSLKDGFLDVTQIKVELYGGMLDGALQIDGRKDIVGLAARTALRKIDLGPVLAETAVAGAVEGRVNFELDAKGRGRSIREIMASLDGRIHLATGKGRIRSRTLQTWVGGPTQILSDILTLNVGGYTTVNCVLGVFDIEEGVAKTSGFLFDTDVAAFVGDGTIDLGAETLDLMVSPEVKKTTLSVAVPVRIRGTLAKPEYSSDRAAVRRRVGGLLGGLVYPPALILGLGELGTFKEGDCVGWTASTGEQVIPERTDQTTDQKPTRLPGKILEGTGKTITKGLEKLLGE